MLARRSFLAFLGLGAGAAAAVKVSSLLPAAAPVESGFKIAYGSKLFRPGDMIYKGVIIRDDRYGFASDLLDAQREVNLRRSLQLRYAELAKLEEAEDVERAKWDAYMNGEQWTPEQIEGMTDA